MKHIILIVLFLTINSVVCSSQVDSVYYGMPYEKLLEFLNGFVNESIVKKYSNLVTFGLVNH